MFTSMAVISALVVFVSATHASHYCITCLAFEFISNQVFITLCIDNDRLSLQCWFLPIAFVAVAHLECWICSEISILALSNWSPLFIRLYPSSKLRYYSKLLCWYMRFAYASCAFRQPNVRLLLALPWFLLQRAKQCAGSSTVAACGARVAVLAMSIRRLCMFSQFISCRQPWIFVKSSIYICLLIVHFRCSVLLIHHVCLSSRCRLKLAIFKLLHSCFRCSKKKVRAFFLVFRVFRIL